MSAPAEGASAAAADETVKIARPTTNIRRRPNRSPSAAPVRSSTAKVSVYALTVHSRLSTVACRSLRITGSAVVTTRLSRVAMKTATDVIAKVQIVRVLADISVLLRGRLFDRAGTGLSREGGWLACWGAVNRHAFREEVGVPVPRLSRDPLDVVDELAVPVPDDHPDRRIVASRVGLHL